MSGLQVSTYVLPKHPMALISWLLEQTAPAPLICPFLPDALMGMASLPVSTIVLPRDVMELIQILSKRRLAEVSFACLPKDVLARIMDMAGPKSATSLFFASKSVPKATLEPVRTDLPQMCSRYIQRLPRWSWCYCL